MSEVLFSQSHQNLSTFKVCNIIVDTLYSQHKAIIFNIQLFQMNYIIKRFHIKKFVLSNEGMMCFKMSNRTLELDKTLKEMTKQN